MIVGRQVKAVDHNPGLREQLPSSSDVGFPHIRTHAANLLTDGLRQRLEPGHERGLGAIRQDCQDNQAAAGEACGHDDDIIAMPFLERNLVNPQCRKRRQGVPINGVAIQRAEDDLVAGILLLADIFNGAIDQLDEEMVLVGAGVQGLEEPADLDREKAIIVCN